MEKTRRKQIIKVLDEFANQYQRLDLCFKKALNVAVDTFIYEIEPIKANRNSFYKYYEGRKQHREVGSFNEEIWRKERGEEK